MRAPATILTAALAAALVVTAACQTLKGPACPSLEAAEVMAKASRATRPLIWQGHYIQVSRTPIVTLKDVTRVRYDDLNFAVLLDFTPEAAGRLEKTTSRPNFPLALLIDQQVVMFAVIQGGYGIGKDGVSVSLDRRKPARDAAATLSRCLSTAKAGKP